MSFDGRGEAAPKPNGDSGEDLQQGEGSGDGTPVAESQLATDARGSTGDFGGWSSAVPRTPERRHFGSRSDSSLAKRGEDKVSHGQEAADSSIPPEGRIRLTVTIGDGLTYIPISSDQMVRESLIKKHFESKVHQLTCQLQLVDSQAIKFFDDAKQLAQRLGEVRLEKTRLEGERDVAKKAEKDMVDRLSTTERGYSAQLNLMTEHVCSLNTKIAEQEALIERLSKARVQKTK